MPLDILKPTRFIQAGYSPVDGGFDKKEKQETSRERAARHSQERRDELTFTESDEQRWRKNRERVIAECSRKIVFLHIGTRSEHQNIVHIVVEFERNGTLKLNSQERLKELVDSNTDYVIGFSGHSIPMKNKKPNRFTYTKVVNGKMGGKVDTAGAMRSISDCLETKGSNIVGLVGWALCSKKKKPWCNARRFGM
ncbi:hypothetical protein [Aliivibrio fischeri]|uniref:Uncharacterized protein n=1 Tax=Aliivibrio fischeri TaxID=668 RepID=A0A510UMF7_ALIFS|nr:hypothetical protein [Aliivibrio fischeri]GEK15843.1 hypothetical protein AFI02nite_38790 [Aliivibrio fischeri]